MSDRYFINLLLSSKKVNDLMCRCDLSTPDKFFCDSEVTAVSFNANPEKFKPDVVLEAVIKAYTNEDIKIAAAWYEGIYPEIYYINKECEAISNGKQFFYVDKSRNIGDQIMQFFRQQQNNAIEEANNLLKQTGLEIDSLKARGRDE